MSSEVVSGGYLQWPVRFPVWRVLALVGGLGVTVGLVVGWTSVDVWSVASRCRVCEQVLIRPDGSPRIGLSALERFYWPEFWRASAAEMVPSPRRWVERKFRRPEEPEVGLDRQVVLSGNMLATAERMKPPIRVVRVVVTNLWLRDWLKWQVFGGRTATGVVKWPLWIGGGFALVLLMLCSQKDINRRRKAAVGMHRRGARMVTGREFNRKVMGVWPFRKRVSLRLPNGAGPDIVVTEQMFHRHICVSGTTGGGKSTLMDSILRQAREQGMACVLSDPAAEGFQRYYRPGIDWVVDIGSQYGSHVLLERDATINEAIATAWAKGLYPGSGEGGGRDHAFFLDGSRRIVAYLLSQNPVGSATPATCAQMAEWVSNEEELVKKLVGSEHIKTLSEAKEQRGAFVAYIASIGPAMRLMQTPGENGMRSLSILEYCERRAAGEDPGWIFFTSTEMDRDANLPMQTALMEMLIRGVQWRQGKHMIPVVFLLDELGTAFRRIPQLTEGMATIRKAKGAMILGVHDMPQLESLYGANGGKTIMDQASTIVAFANNDPFAASYISRRIGEEEISRLKEQRPMHLVDKHNRGRSWSMEIMRQFVVIDAEIQALPPFHGYVAQRGLVTKYQTVVQDMPLVTPPLEREIPRYIPKYIREETVVELEAEPGAAAEEPEETGDGGVTVEDLATALMQVAKTLKGSAKPKANGKRGVATGQATFNNYWAKDPTCPICQRDEPGTPAHWGSDRCQSGSLMSKGTVAHCDCEICS